MRELVEALVPLPIDEPVFIVLDHAEALLEMDSRGFGLLCRLRQLCSNHRNISIILISRRLWSEFGPLTSTCFPHIISDFTMALPSAAQVFAHPTKQHEAFLSLIYDTTKSQHRDASYIISLIKRSHALASETKRVNLSSRPEFKQLLNATDISATTDAVTLESISLIEKWLLMACFLASNIHPRNDVKVFHHEHKKRRIMAKKPGKIQVRDQRDGKKKIVAMERLLAIFYHIYQHNHRAPQRSLVLHALQRLCETKLMLRLTPVAKLDAYKFRSNTPLAFIRALSRSLDFQYGPYLAGDL